MSKVEAYAGQIFSSAVRDLLALDRWKKRALVLSADAVTCALSAWFAFSLRLSEWMPWSPPLVTFTAVTLLLFPIIFFATGAYRHIFRFAGSGTILQLAHAVGILAIPLILIFTFFQFDGIPRTIAILFPILFFLLTAISRIMARYVLVELFGANGGIEVKRCLIYGAGASGQQLASSIRHDPGFSLIAYADDDIRLDRQRLDGLTVHHSERLAALIERHAIDTIFLAMPSISRERRKEIIGTLTGLDVSVQLLPSVADLVDGKVSVSDLREIRIEDLLGRTSVAPNDLLLSRTIRDKTVLVTGAGGSIGSELCRQIVRAHPKRLILAEVSEHNLYLIEREMTGFSGLDGVSGPEIVPQLINMADRPQVDRLFSRWRPDTVFHAAAYKHVPLVEANVVSGLRNNIDGTLNAGLAAKANGVSHFVLISTDKAVRPTNVMGASKRVCELVLQALAKTPDKTRFAMVRFGNVLGSSGSVVPQFERQIRAGGPVTLTHRDITRFFMTIPEAAQLVIQAGAMAEGGEVFLLDMGAPIRIYDLARSMIELSGRTVRDENNPDGDIEIVEIGLRPGEKLYEELLIDSESRPTRHPRIMHAHEYSLEESELMPMLDRLHACFLDGDRETALSILRRLVPEYVSESGLNTAQIPAS
ncbi:capsule biosynthesis protein CapD [Erythrobacter sp. HI0063]|nr:capsule biosynthesis protein CapD [Erythrobacter sp. HI0063]